MVVTEPFTLDGDTHTVADPDCSSCWEGPLACSDPSCSGLVHTAFGDENWDSYWLYYRCDICDSTDSPY